MSRLYRNIFENFGTLSRSCLSISLSLLICALLRTIVRSSFADAYFFRFHPSVASQICSQVLSGDQVPSTIYIFSFALRISTSVLLNILVSSTLSGAPEASVLVATRPHGSRGCQLSGKRKALPRARLYSLHARIGTRLLTYLKSGKKNLRSPSGLKFLYLLVIHLLFPQLHLLLHNCSLLLR